MLNPNVIMQLNILWVLPWLGGLHTLVTIDYKIFITNLVVTMGFAYFLNQARTGLWPACAWFLEIDPVCKVYVCVYVCVSTPEASNN